MSEVKFNSESFTYIWDFSDQIIPFDQVLRQASEAIARDKEGKIRRALIEMGWTPPKEITPPQE